MKSIRILAVSLCALAFVSAPVHAEDVPGVTKDTIKIGVIGPMTGAAAIFGKSVFGVEALFKEVNEQGGIHGRKIEVVREDDACDPARGISAMKKEISQDQVFAVNGIACTGVALAVKPEVAKTDMPLMIMSAAGEPVATPAVANIFQAVPTTGVVARSMIDFAMTRPDTSKIAFVSHSDDWGKSNREPAVARLKEKYHLDPVLNLTMERGSNDATPQILQIRNSGAQFVVLMMYPAEVAIFVRDAYKYGLQIPMLAPMSISLEDTRDRVGGQAAVQNLYVFYPYIGPFGSPEMQHWTDLIKKYYPNERIENFSFLGMGSTITLIDALKKAGPDLTRQKVIDTLNNTKNYDTGILSAPVTFAADDHAGVKGGAMATFRDNKVVVLKSWQ